MARERRSEEHNEAQNQGQKRRRRAARDDAVDNQHGNALVDNGAGENADEPNHVERANAGGDRRAGWAAVARRSGRYHFDGVDL